jgi:hypothetical protein
MRNPRKNQDFRSVTDWNSLQVHVPDKQLLAALLGWTASTLLAHINRKMSAESSQTIRWVTFSMVHSLSSCDTCAISFNPLCFWEQKSHQGKRLPCYWLQIPSIWTFRGRNLTRWLERRHTWRYICWFQHSQDIRSPVAEMLFSLIILPKTKCALKGGANYVILNRKRRVTNIAQIESLSFDK